jgi:ribosomal protein S18 acetylase RimI-like enzyme
MRIVSRKGEDENGREFVAWEKGTIIGYASIRGLEEKCPYVHSVWVDEPFRQRGVASKLMKKLVDFCPDKPMYLHVSRGKQNIPAVTLYRKFGFRFLATTRKDEMRRKP